MKWEESLPGQFDANLYKLRMRGLASSDVSSLREREVSKLRQVYRYGSKIGFSTLAAIATGGFTLLPGLIGGRQLHVAYQKLTIIQAVMVESTIPLHVSDLTDKVQPILTSLIGVGIGAGIGLAADHIIHAGVEGAQAYGLDSAPVHDYVTDTASALLSPSDFAHGMVGGFTTELNQMMSVIQPGDWHTNDAISTYLDTVAAHFNGTDALLDGRNIGSHIAEFTEKNLITLAATSVLDSAGKSRAKREVELAIMKERKVKIIRQKGALCNWAQGLSITHRQFIGCHNALKSRYEETEKFQGQELFVRLPSDGGDAKELKEFEMMNYGLLQYSANLVSSLGPLKAKAEGDKTWQSGTWTGKTWYKSLDAWQSALQKHRILLRGLGRHQIAWICFIKTVASSLDLPFNVDAVSLPAITPSENDDASSVSSIDSIALAHEGRYKAMVVAQIDGLMKMTEACTLYIRLVRRQLEVIADLKGSCDTKRAAEMSSLGTTSMEYLQKSQSALRGLDGYEDRAEETRDFKILDEWDRKIRNYHANIHQFQSSLQEWRSCLDRPANEPVGRPKQLMKPIRKNHIDKLYRHMEVMIHTHCNRLKEDQERQDKTTIESFQDIEEYVPYFLRTKELYDSMTSAYNGPDEASSICATYDRAVEPRLALDNATFLNRSNRLQAWLNTLENLTQAVLEYEIAGRTLLEYMSSAWRAIKAAQSAEEEEENALLFEEYSLLSPPMDSGYAVADSNMTGYFEAK